MGAGGGQGGLTKHTTKLGPLRMKLQKLRGDKIKIYNILLVDN